MFKISDRKKECVLNNGILKQFKNFKILILGAHSCKVNSFLYQTEFSLIIGELLN